MFYFSFLYNVDLQNYFPESLQFVVSVDNLKLDKMKYVINGL